MRKLSAKGTKSGKLDTVLEDEELDKLDSLIDHYLNKQANKWAIIW